MQVEDAETRRPQQRFLQDVATREHNYVGRPLVKLRDGIWCILVPARDDWEAIARRDLPQTTNTSRFVFEELLQVGIAQLRIRAIMRD